MNIKFLSILLLFTMIFSSCNTLTNINSDNIKEDPDINNSEILSQNNVVNEDPITSNNTEKPHPNNENLSVDDIKPGTKYSEIVKIIGKEGTSIGSGAILYEWHMNDGNYLYVWFNPSSSTQYEKLPDDLTVNSIRIEEEKLYSNKEG